MVTLCLSTSAAYNRHNENGVLHLTRDCIQWAVAAIKGNHTVNRVVLLAQNGDDSAYFCKQTIRKSEIGDKLECRVVHSLFTHTQAFPAYTDVQDVARAVFRDAKHAGDCSVAYVSMSESPLDVAFAKAFRYCCARETSVKYKHVALLTTDTVKYIQDDLTLIRAPRFLAPLALCVVEESQRIIARVCTTLAVWTPAFARRFASCARKVYVLRSVIPDTKHACGGAAQQRQGIVCVSRLMRAKSSHIMIRACIPPLSTVVRLYGSDIEADVHTKQLLRKTIGKGVHFNGNVQHTLIPEIFSQAEFSVICSQSETRGLVILESVAEGCPCLVSSIGEHVEYYASQGLICADTCRIDDRGEITGQPSSLIVVNDIADTDQNEAERVCIWRRALSAVCAAPDTFKTQCVCQCYNDIRRLRAEHESRKNMWHELIDL